MDLCDAEGKTSVGMSGAQANGHVRGREDLLTRTEVTTTGRPTCRAALRDGKSLKSVMVSSACDLRTTVYKNSAVHMVMNVWQTPPRERFQSPAPEAPSRAETRSQPGICVLPVVRQRLAPLPFISDILAVRESH